MNTMHHNNGNFNQRHGFNSQYNQYMNNDMVPLSQEYVQKLATEVMKQMQTQNQYNTRSNNVMGKLFNRQDSFGSNQNFGNNFNNMRFKRQADAGVTNVLDLGDRLRDKIVEAEKHAEQKIGNMTCVMKEMNIINDNHEIDLAALNIPVDVQTAYAYPGNPHLAKLKAFMTCCKTAKTQSCVYQDVRDKLEKNFGPLQKLLDTTGLTEQQIFPLVLQLLHGSEMEFMETM